jgi:hypothetical protein
MNLPPANSPPNHRGRPLGFPSPLPSDGRGEGQGEVRVPRKNDGLPKGATAHYLFFASMLAKRLSMLLKGKFTFPLGCKIWRK